MLDGFRKRTNNLAFTFLILLIVAVMAFFGVDMAQRSGGGGGAAAFVNGEPITEMEFRQELQARLQQYQQILGAQYDEKLILQLRLPQQTLQQLIQYKLLAQQASSMDIIVPDQELASHIRSLPYFQVNGKFDASLYQRLPNKGFEEKRQRERLQVIKLQDYLQGRVKLSPNELERATKLSESKLELAYANIDFDKLSSKHTPTRAAIDRLLKGDDKPLKEYYEANKADYTEPASSRIRQIRVGVPYQASDEKKKQSRSKIDELAQMADSDNFAEIAKKHSDDEYATKGGDRGWIKKGALGANFEAAIDSLSAGQISGVVENSSGFYLIQVVEKKDQKVKPFDSVKRSVATKVAINNHAKNFKEEKTKAWNAKLAKGLSIENELKRLGVKIEKTGEFNLGQGYIPKLGQSDAVMDSIFKLTRKNQVAPSLITDKNNKTYFVRVASMTSPSSKLIAEKKETVENSVSAGIQSELVNRWLTSIQNKASIEEHFNFSSEDLSRM